MLYYKTSCEKLIQYNPETKVYKIRNNIKREDTRISKEDMDNLNPCQIKKNEFSRLMNVFFKDVEHEWEFEGVKYKKLPNFKSEDHSFSSNYVIGKNVPYHKTSEYRDNNIMVYHWGKIYYHNISYGGYKQGILSDIKTGNMICWAQLKHCAPILNMKTNKIM